MLRQIPITPKIIMLDYPCQKKIIKQYFLGLKTWLFLLPLTHSWSYFYLIVLITSALWFFLQFKILSSWKVYIKTWCTDMLTYFIPRPLSATDDFMSVFLYTDISILSFSIWRRDVSINYYIIMLMMRFQLNVKCYKTVSTTDMLILLPLRL